MASSLLGVGANSPFANLSLTATQQTQIQSILQTAQNQGDSFSQVIGQVDNVLSSSQQQTLQTDLATLKSQHSGHHHGGHGGGGAPSTADVLSPDYESPDTDSSQTTTTALTDPFTALAQSQLQNQLLQFGSTTL